MLPLFNSTPFWYTWPSWLVELVSGAVLQVALFAWGGHSVALNLLAGLAVSAFYEWGLDRNGWEWVDVGQRFAGQAVILVVQAVL